MFDPRPHFRRVPVLDKGHVELFDAMVGDPILKIVNAARVSFHKESTEVTDRDIKLVKFLDEHKHHSTFRHSYFSFRIKAPLCVFRQWWKHQIGCEWIEDDCPPSVGSIELPSTSWNEVSGRYVEFEPEFYIPDVMRFQSKDNKQGSEGNANGLEIQLGTAVFEPRQLLEYSCLKQYDVYVAMVKAGLAKEQARMILPQNIYTECVLTLSLQALLYFFSLRLKPDAQLEIRNYAQALFDLVAPMLKDIITVR